jgi:DTW domain-containing protein YfiP
MPSERQYCQNCSYPQSVCLCHALKPVVNNTRVFILRHPSETRQAKNTVPLLQLSLASIEVINGEQESDFKPIRDWCINNKEHVAVLYPNPDSQSLAGVRVENRCSLSAVLLIDGTWRKVYKIWRSNPWLQQLNSFHLQDIPSIYRRRANTGNSLSTLEATAGALRLIEGMDTKPLTELLRVRQRFLYCG